MNTLLLCARVDEARRALRAAERMAAKWPNSFTRTNLASAQAEHDLCVAQRMAEQEPSESDVAWMLAILAKTSQGIPADVVERLTTLDFVDSHWGPPKLSPIGRVWLAEKTLLLP